MKKTLALVLAMAMSLTLMAGCGAKPAEPTPTPAPSTSTPATSEPAPAPAEVKTVKFGNSGAIGEPAPISCQEFCDLLNERLGDRYKFEFYPAEQLGNEATMLENLQVGLQEGMMCALDTLASYEADLNILSMAFAFDSFEAMVAYLKSDVADSVWANLDAQGLHVVNFEFQKNPRIFFGNREINDPSDMAGMKYRIPNLPIFEKNARAMGSVPTVVAWSEYPFALLQGVVDGGECSKDSYRSAGLYEAAKYVAEVDYAYPTEQICFSTQFWNSLSAEDQKVIEDTAAEVAANHTKKTLEQWGEDKEWLINEGGVTFCEIDRQAFIDAAAPLGAELQAEGFFTTPDLYDQTRQFNG